MKWKTFFQIVVLLLIAGMIFYFVSPKYYFSIRSRAILRGNKITGGLMIYGAGSGNTLEWKKNLK